MSPDDKRHGKRSGYLAGCRCTPCYDANRSWIKTYRYRASLNQGTTTMDAAPIRTHLLALTETMSLSSVEAASGVSRSTIRRLRLGEIKRVRPVTAKRILAVRPYQADLGKHYVDARSTRRRLQALHALGYSLERLEKMTGFSKSNLRQVIFGKRPMVFGDTADKVRAAYDIHSMRLPVAANRIEQGHITKARNRAKRLGWLPPLAWEDIDADATPVMGRDVNPGGGLPWRELLAEYEFFTGTGMTRQHALERLGVTEDAIEKAEKKRRLAERDEAA